MAEAQATASGEAPSAMVAAPLLIMEQGPVARFILRGEAAIRALDGVLTLPRVPHSTVDAGPRSALWLGPDEWLLIDEAPTVAAPFSETLASALDATACSFVDISHRQCGIALTGEDATDAIAMFVPLDLALAAFPVGMATRTVFEKSEIVLWRRAEARFHIEVARSFTPYVRALLDQAQRELDAERHLERT